MHEGKILMRTEPKRGHAEVMRDEMIMKDKIIELLKDEPKTIGELSEALGRPSHETMLWVMAMWRFGTIVEVEKGRTEEYFQYELKQEQPS